MTSVSKRPLYHVLYTNAAGGEEMVGFRPIPIAFPAGEDERRPIDEWLQGLHPTLGTSYGVACDRFALDNVNYAAIALVLPSFLCDDRDRPARLTHALLLPVHHGEAVGHFDRALFNQARRFLNDINDSAPSLAKYQEGCRVASDIQVPPLDMREVERFSWPFLAAFFAAAQGELGSEVLLEAPDEETLAEWLVTASGTLPPPLRLRVRWRVGVQGAGAGFLARAGGPGVVSRDAERGPAGALADGLLAQLGADPAAVVQIAGNWSIDRWERLRDAYTSPPPPAQTVSPAAGGGAGNHHGGRATLAGAPVDAPVPAGARSSSRTKTAAEYDEEYQSLYSDLVDYINRRFAGLGEPPAELQRQSTSAGSSGPAVVPPRWPRQEWARRTLGYLARLRPEIYLAITLCLVAWLATREPARPPTSHYGAPLVGDLNDIEPAPERRQSPDDVVAVPEDAQPLPAESLADPVAAWAEFLAREPSRAADWFRALVEHRGLEEKQVGQNRKEDFEKRVRILGAGGLLSREHLDPSATGTFEYVHALWAVEEGRAKPEDQVVSGDPAEAEENLSALLQNLGLEGRFASPKSTDPAVRAAVALAWIKRHPEGPPEP